MKRYLSILVLLILSIQICIAETMPEWDANTTFLYGMSVYQIDGETLMAPPVNVDTLKSGLLIRIENGMPHSDRGILMFVLNGEIQPFYITDEAQYYSEFTVEANETLEVKVTFNDVNVVEEKDVQYLHIIQIGLLDQIPSDAYDYNDVYTNVCSIPIAAACGRGISDTNELDSIPISDTLYMDIMENGGMICFSEKIDDEHIYIKQCIEQGSLPYQLQVTAFDIPKRISILLLVDGVPWEPEKTLCSGHMRTNCALQMVYEFRELAPGDHKICAIMIPTDESIMIPIASSMLLLSLS